MGSACGRRRIHGSGAGLLPDEWSGTAESLWIGIQRVARWETTPHLRPDRQPLERPGGPFRGQKPKQIFLNPDETDQISTLPKGYSLKSSQGARGKLQRQCLAEKIEGHLLIAAPIFILPKRRIRFFRLWKYFLELARHIGIFVWILHMVEKLCLYGINPNIFKSA